MEDTDLEVQTEAEDQVATDSVQETEQVLAPPPAETDAGLTPQQIIAKAKELFDKGEIKGDDLSFADRQWQSAFSRRINAVKQNLDQVGRDLVSKGIELPDGKTMYDLLSEEGGRGFVNVMSGVMEGAVAPIRDKIARAENDQMVKNQIAIAQQEYPEVKKHFARAVEIADKNPDLQEAALVQGGRYLPYILAGVAKDLELRETQQKLAEMAKVVEKAGLAVKVGSKTTQAGGKPVVGGEKKPRSLADIAGLMWDKAVADGQIPS